MPFFSFFFLRIRRPPRSTLFPYTTLFRSGRIAMPNIQLVRGLEGGLMTELANLGENDVVVAFGFEPYCAETLRALTTARAGGDRKSTRLNSSHVRISYAVFCLKKKTTSSS